MKIPSLLLLLSAVFPCQGGAAERPFGLVVHGGAGVIVRDKFSAGAEAQYRAIGAGTCANNATCAL